MIFNDIHRYLKLYIHLKAFSRRTTNSIQSKNKYCTVEFIVVSQGEMKVVRSSAFFSHQSELTL